MTEAGHSGLHSTPLRSGEFEGITAVLLQEFGWSSCWGIMSLSVPGREPFSRMCLTPVLLMESTAGPGKVEDRPEKGSLLVRVPMTQKQLAGIMKRSLWAAEQAFQKPFLITGIAVNLEAWMLKQAKWQHSGLICLRVAQFPKSCQQTSLYRAVWCVWAAVTISLQPLSPPQAECHG